MRVIDGNGGCGWSGEGGTYGRAGQGNGQTLASERERERERGTDGWPVEEASDRRTRGPVARALQRSDQGR